MTPAACTISSTVVSSIPVSKPRSVHKRIAVRTSRRLVSRERSWVSPARRRGDTSGFIALESRSAACVAKIHHFLAWVAIKTGVGGGEP